MKTRSPLAWPGALFSAIAVLSLPSPLTAQVLAVEFGGDYNNSSNNADKSGYLLENGDFDDEADSDDRRGHIPFGTLFTNIADVNGVGNNTRIYHGTQQTHLDGTGADPALGIFRFQNGTPDKLQCGHGGTTAITQQTFAPHVVKSDFLNGADSTGSELSFEDAPGSVTVSLGEKSGKSPVNRALVKNGSDWYVSTTTSGGLTDLSFNGYTEMWIPYDPEANLYVSPTTLAGTAVAGSTLTDIRAFGAVIQQNDIASGRSGNDDRFSVDGFSARMVVTPIPLAVDFSGDFISSNQNAPDKSLTGGLEEGDFDFDGDDDDFRGFRPIDSPFGTIANPNSLPNKTRTIHAGYQIATLDFFDDPPVPGLYRFPDEDSIQVTSGGYGFADAFAAMGFTPHVRKEDFANGFSANNQDLFFTDRSNSITIDMRQATLVDTIRALVKNGSQWYVSASEITNASTLTINGLTETWYPYDPTSNQFIDTSSLSGGVSGSTLTDIQAVGAFIQEMFFDAENGNAANWQVQSITAILGQTPPLPTDPVRVVNSAQSYDNNNSDGLTTHTLADFPVISNDHRKLIVAISYESAADVTGITYGGTPMTKADGAASRDAEIWYLDDPAVGVADIVATFAAANTRSRMGALSVSGTADGFGPTNDGGINGTALSVGLTTDATDTLIVSCFNTNGSGAGISTTPSNYDGTFAFGDSGSSAADAGYASVPTSGTLTTFDWTLGGAQSMGAVLVGFPPEPGYVQPPVPPSLENFSIPELTTAPTIDGTLSAGEWDDAYALDMRWPDLTISPNYGGVSTNNSADPVLADPADISGTLYFTWDATYLYVGFDITDDTFIAPAPGGAGFPDDHFLFGFNPDTSTTGVGTTFLAEFFFNSSNTAEGFFRTTLGDPSLNVFTNHDLAGATDAEGWNFEMRLKWTDITGDPGYVPANNDLFGAAVLLADNDQNDSARDVFLYSAGGGNTSVMTTPADWHDVTLSATAGGNDFSDWISGFPGVGGLTGLNDDPDGDGNDNGVENFFGTAPDIFSKGLAAGSVDTGTNTFTFTHPINATPADDLTATYRWSTDLSTFYNDGASNGGGTTTVTFTPGTPSGGEVTVEAAITGSVIPGRLFVDIEVTQ